jgi:thymidylate kinase
MIRKLIDNLSEVNYCHWKSNLNLEQSLTGKTDLDLLVRSSDCLLFKSIVLFHGFKEVIAFNRSQQYPGIEDYLGFDKDTGVLFHLHVHYRLVLGEKKIKNHRLPVESCVISSSISHTKYKIQVPCPEWELILLIIRLILNTDIIDSMILYKSLKIFIPLQIVDEYNWLYKKIDLMKFEGILKKQKNILPVDIINEFIEKWDKNNLGIIRILILKKKLLKFLKPFQRESTTKTILLKTFKFFSNIFLTGKIVVRKIKFLNFSKNHHNTNKKKRLLNGGLTIAIMGADGAGKSTSIKELQQWLNKKLNIISLYMGSNQPSMLGYFYKYPMIYLHKLQRIIEIVAGKNNCLYKLIKFFARLFFALRAILFAKDRLKRYLSGIKNANNGNITIYDRYYLPYVDKYMDGPQIWRQKDFIYRVLGKKEKSIYKKILLPDVLIILQISPNTALSRKDHGTPERVKQKCIALERVKKYDMPNTYHIKSEQPIDNMLLELKNIIWNSL